MNRRASRASEANGRRLMKKGWSDWELMPQPDLRKYPSLDRVTAVWKNNMYIVQVFVEADCEWGPIERLLVRRNDGSKVRDWADLQRIKNEIAGPDRVAVEVFPAVAALVDSADVYHLWVLPEGFQLPFWLEK